MIKDKYYEEKEYAFGCRRPSLGDSSEPNMSDCRKKCDDTSNCNFFQFYNPSSAGASENCGFFTSQTKSSNFKSKVTKCFPRAINRFFTSD